jgi:hypothetical protein
MKIVSITDEEILFDNGNTITFDHRPDCCEHNYADFEQLDDVARAVEFDPDLEFQACEGAGFLFGNRPGKMFFVPCYSCQNGYYSTDVAIYYNGELAEYLKCQEDFDC